MATSRDKHETFPVDIPRRRHAIRILKVAKQMLKVVEDAILGDGTCGPTRPSIRRRRMEWRVWTYASMHQGLLIDENRLEESTESRTVGGTSSCLSKRPTQAFSIFVKARCTRRSSHASVSSVHGRRGPIICCGRKVRASNYFPHPREMNRPSGHF